MIDTIADAVTGRLLAAGISAARGYPSSLLDKSEGPVICVRVVSGSISGAGCGEYLGTRTDPVSEDTVELFGLKMDVVLGLDIYSPMKDGAEICSGCFSDAAVALFSPFSGFSNKALRCGAVAPDRETEMFRCPAEFSCCAYLVCSADENTGEFTDFVLRGEII